MRSALSLTMCAYLAVAAAPALAVQSNYFIKFDGMDPGNGGADQHKETIEISSWQWGATRAQGKVEHEWKVEEGESAPPQPGTAKYGAVSGVRRDESMKGSKVGQNAPGGDVDQPLIVGRIPNASVEREMKESGEKGGTEDINIGVGELQEAPGKPRELPVMAGRVEGAAASGQATGKRQHKPIRASAYNDASTAPAEKRQHGWPTLSKPLDRGAVRVKVKFPWVGCRVGARYPALTLGGGAERYELTDAVVTSCGSASSGGDSLPMEEVSFNYGKVTVRGWDPATKQE